MSKEQKINRKQDKYFLNCNNLNPTVIKIKPTIKIIVLTVKIPICKEVLILVKNKIKITANDKLNTKQLFFYFIITL